MNPGSQFSVLGSQFSVLSSQFPVLSSQFSVPGSQFPVLSSRFSVLSSQFSVLGSQVLHLMLAALQKFPATIARPVEVMRGYSLETLRADLVAGITVGLVLLPRPPA